jgi:environmental stress-induced protein Ves
MILELGTLAPSPWKNGGGLTREIAAGPPGCNLEDFHWRLSLADIAPGVFAFSRFAGIERHTLVLGAGLWLGPAGAPRSALRQVEPLSALQLDGQEALQAVLEGAPIQAFNLMLRRGQAEGALAVHTCSTPLAAATTLRALYGMQGRSRVRVGDQAFELPAGSVALLRDARASAPAQLEVLEPRTRVLGATISQTGASADRGGGDRAPTT